MNTNINNSLYFLFSFDQPRITLRNFHAVFSHWIILVIIIHRLLTSLAYISKTQDFRKPTSCTIWVAAAATPVRFSCDWPLSTYTNYISLIHTHLPIQWPAQQLPITNQMSGKPEVANPSHQLSFIASHPSTPTSEGHKSLKKLSPVWLHMYSVSAVPPLDLLHHNA